MQNKNQVLGEVWCLTPDCGQKMNVYKNKKGFLYGRCPDCGCQQQTGGKVQEYFSKFVDVGVLCLEDDHIDPVLEYHASMEASETSEKQANQASEQEAKPGSKKPLVLAGLGALALAVVSII